jgi:hypothetical protein
MTQDGIFRVLNMRIDDLDKEIAYLFEVNPMSPFPGSTETINQYANGRIAALQEEKKFIITVIRQLIK